MAVADFEPERKVIIALTNANPAVVTATSHGFSTDDIVTINVPSTYGMRIPRKQATITVVDANMFSVNIDTALFATFAVPVVTPFTAAEVLPISAILDNVAT